MAEKVNASKQHGTRKRKRKKAKIWICFQSCFGFLTDVDGKKHKGRSKFSKAQKTVPRREDLVVHHYNTETDRESNLQESKQPQSDPIEPQPCSSTLTINTPVLCPILSSNRCRTPCNPSKVVGFAGILVILLTILAGGRLFAVVCVSAWFYLIPWIRSSRNARLQTCAKSFNKRHSEKLPPC